MGVSTITVEKTEEMVALVEKMKEVYVKKCPKTFKKNSGELIFYLELEELVGSDTVPNVERRFYIEKFESGTREHWKIDENERDFFANAGFNYAYEEDVAEEFSFLADYYITNNVAKISEFENDTFEMDLSLMWDYDIYLLKKETKEKFPEAKFYYCVETLGLLDLKLSIDEKIISLDAVISNQEIILKENQLDRKTYIQIEKIIKKALIRKGMKKAFQG